MLLSCTPDVGIFETVALVLEGGVFTVLGGRGRFVVAEGVPFLRRVLDGGLGREVLWTVVLEEDREWLVETRDIDTFETVALILEDLLVVLGRGLFALADTLLVSIVDLSVVLGTLLNEVEGEKVLVDEIIVLDFDTWELVLEVGS